MVAVDDVAVVLCCSLVMDFFSGFLVDVVVSCCIVAVAVAVAGCCGRWSVNQLDGTLVVGPSVSSSISPSFSYQLATLQLATLDTPHAHSRSKTHTGAHAGNPSATTSPLTGSRIEGFDRIFVCVCVFVLRLSISFPGCA